MGYPNYKNRAEMKAAGYVFEGSGECNKCGATVDWAKTKNAKKVPFDVGSTVCHFDTCGKGQPARQQPARQEQPPATSTRPGSAVAQEMVVALRALNTNVLALNATMQALLARLGRSWAAEEKPAVGGGPNGAMVNDHGLEVTDADVPF